METSVKIRRARKADVPRLAELSGELGYPVTTKEMKERFAQIKPAAQHAVFVAEAGREVIGWIHVSITPLLEVSRRAEVNGLIVADGQRSSGAGAKLLDAAEKWARAKSCKGMSVRSNVIRERAHLFYERHGYIHQKTQKAFRKPL
ncbi:MAG TPA: GNAT family N-acetyltransferase [Candidatus Dormibacteraeota bacterium]|jgi:GNAT superfamily N-acetyltransferase|nr:GNAT family N-acetyltransferase [Candidatus Dormibacteraeota bacterium]